MLDHVFSKGFFTELNLFTESVRVALRGANCNHLEWSPNSFLTSSLNTPKMISSIPKKDDLFSNQCPLLVNYLFMKLGRGNIRSINWGIRLVFFIKPIMDRGGGVEEVISILLRKPLMIFGETWAQII